MSQPRVYAIDGVTPVVDPSSYVHPSAVLIGDVVIGRNCYIGPGACLRGDFGRILIGDGANVQDTCVMHGFPGTNTIIEDDGHIGHGAILHGCRVRRGGLVGMNAVVNDNAEVGEYAIVAAMAFVRAEMIIPPRMLVAGSPARVLRELTDVELAWKAEGTRSYQDLTLRSLRTMTETVALAAPEPDRKKLKLPELLPLSELKARKQE